MYNQCVYIIEECRQFYICNAHNFIHLIYNFFNQCIQLCAFKVQNFQVLKKKVHNFQRIYKIMFIQHTNYLNNVQNFQTLQNLSKIVHNFIHLTNKIFQKSVINSLNSQFQKKSTQFCTFNIHIFKKYIQFYITYTIFLKM